jgi:hypothetical protein
MEREAKPPSGVGPPESRAQALRRGAGAPWESGH